MVAKLDQLRAGDTLVVVRIDRLARSLSHLLTVIEQVRDAGGHFRSLGATARSLCASPDPRWGGGGCARTSGPCNTPAQQRRSPGLSVMLAGSCESTYGILTRFKAQIRAHREHDDQGDDT